MQQTGENSIDSVVFDNGLIVYNKSSETEWVEIRPLCKAMEIEQ